MSALRKSASPAWRATEPRDPAERATAWCRRVPRARDPDSWCAWTGVRSWEETDSEDSGCPARCSLRSALLRSRWSARSCPRPGSASSTWSGGSETIFSPASLSSSRTARGSGARTRTGIASTWTCSPEPPAARTWTQSALFWACQTLSPSRSASVWVWPGDSVRLLRTAESGPDFYSWSRRRRAGRTRRRCSRCPRRTGPPAALRPTDSRGWNQPRTLLTGTRTRPLWKHKHRRQMTGTHTDMDWFHQQVNLKNILVKMFGKKQLKLG